MTYEPYTVAITSCGRFDLLERTLRSLLPRLEGSVHEIIVIEDSGSSAVSDVIRQFHGPYGDIKVIINKPPLGQTKSIDKLYSHIATEWIFHCEDDWEFYSANFISQSFKLLMEFPNLSMVSPRDPSTFRPNYFLPETISLSGVRFRVTNDADAGPFSGFLLSPGLRRMSDYKVIGPYSSLGAVPMEPRIGEVYRALGFRVGILSDHAVRHIGDGRHIADLTKSHAARKRIMRSVRKRYERLFWRCWPRADPVFRARQRRKLLTEECS